MNSIYPRSQLPIRRTVELLPSIFRTPANDKFMSAVVDPLVQPGILQKTVGYIGRRYGTTYNGTDIYLDSDDTLRSRYQLEPGVVSKDGKKIVNFYDYLDFKNQLKFFGNDNDRDDQITNQEHYSWNPPVKHDSFVNYREYYWEPEGPPSIPIYGQATSIISTYTVKLGLNSFIFTPDAYTNNPTLTLYRGQTYRFRVNVPGDGFVIRRNYDTNSLAYDPVLPYAINQLAVYDARLWKAKINMAPLVASFPAVDNINWEFIELLSTDTVLDFNLGITNNGIEKGEITFTVPHTSPDTLFYQSLIDSNKIGRFIISDILTNTVINVETEIIGKLTYTSSNGIVLSSGMVLEFRGTVLPTKYASHTWLVESVGTSITLTRFIDLVVPVLSNIVPEILFDNEGFDSQPFDDAAAYPTQHDYITISRNSIDTNPWSRYNRWFHRSVLEYSYTARGQDFPAAETARAKRPIIEFLPNLQLFNHGSIAMPEVDYLDDFTTDVSSTIEGSIGYNIDGELIFDGARILISADTDSLTNNRIYQVQFITHNNRTQIHLVPTTESEISVGAGVLIRRGKVHASEMYHYTGITWVRSQSKTSVNQSPLFDVFNSNGVSFSDLDSYQNTTFPGTPILSYKIGVGRIDKQLGFPLSYLNIDNVGDIQFNFDWDTDEFAYVQNKRTISKRIATGFYRVNPASTYGNCWIATLPTFIQPIIDSITVSSPTNILTLNTIDWTLITSDADFKIKFYINGRRYTGTYTRIGGVFTFDTTFNTLEVITIKMIVEAEPNVGYYTIPVGLEKNPLNSPITGYTLGQAADHLYSALDFNDTWSGTIPGNSTLRDIATNNDGTNYINAGTRFLRHSGLAPMAVSLLCDKTVNIIKSIQYAKKSYTDFKNNFIERAISLPYNNNVANFVDDIVISLSNTKTVDSAFAESDTIGSGAYTMLNYIVDDIGIKTFALSSKFTLHELSRSAVYIYLNNKQLLNEIDYTFNPTFGFAKLNIELKVNDVIEIREYLSTSTNFIPSTPSSMGLYKKYKPMIFVDDTFVEPKKVIQGHDGSITVAYDDFRDELLLEFENRIYNNIKQQYDSTIFDIDNTIGGYYGTGLYSKSQLDEIVSQEFLKWVQNSSTNYTLNSYLDTENSFTYTYSNMTDPTGSQNLPGYWRGVYQWFYDTDRPHRCPWEMLGFSEIPTWWEAQYGAAPYTSGNLILWEDLRDGIIRKGSRAGTHDRYKRSLLLSHIPVDGDGKLLSPLDSGLAGNYTLVNNKGSFILGDVSPVEYAWRSSSEWPFAIMTALCLMQPFKFIISNFDRSRTKLNILGQTVHASTELFVTLADIVVPTTGGELAVGLVRYLVDYVRSRGLSVEVISNKITSLDVQLSTTLSGFVDQEQQKYLLDSKNIKAATSGVFIPPENYDIIFNVSTPITSIAYSGAILEKCEGGWIITGYDNIHPFFNFYKATPAQGDPILSVGGVSEPFLEWTSGKAFNNGQVIRNASEFYRALKTHLSGDKFDVTLWKQIPNLPLTGSIEALRRKNFNSIRLDKLRYGEILVSVQQVVDFLLGYEKYLISIGFAFTGYDSDAQVARDWTTSCKEFMFWTKHNWAIGSLITLSPSAQELELTTPVGVADNLLDGFYDYQLLKSDGRPLHPNNITINRSFQKITIVPTTVLEGVYYLRLYYVLKEHVTIFSDRTVFNDVIYDKPTGYRQDRIKSNGFRTVDWDGDYTSPGFIFDNVSIQVWQPFTDYRIGDIVAYRSYNWTSQYTQLGTEFFNNAYWTQLDSTPTKQLISNFDYKINQFEDYYDTNASGASMVSQGLARHAIGYQTREYLQSLSEDTTTQFQLYQGFIRDKGSLNAITKVFNKLSRFGDASIVLNEDWAFKVGELGGVDQLIEVEFELAKSKFVTNPQPVLLITTHPTSISDQYYRISQPNFTIEPIPFTLEINPVAYEAEPKRVAGYVQSNQVDFIIANRDEILNFAVTDVSEDNHIWITFDNFSWSVVRYNKSKILSIRSVAKTDAVVDIILNRPHHLVVGDIIGITNVLNLAGFFKIIEIQSPTSISVAVSATANAPELDISTTVTIGLFTEVRVASYHDIDVQEAALMPNNAKFWVDNNSSNRWEVIEKKKQYVASELVEYGSTAPLSTGTKVLYNNVLNQTISSMPGSGYVMIYSKTSEGLKLKQLIEPPNNFSNVAIGSFGTSMALSSDGRFLIIGTPYCAASSNYRGDFSASANYAVDEVVLSAGKLWKATNDIVGDGSTINVYSDDWAPVTILQTVMPYLASNQGYSNQGMISIYETVGQLWTHSYSFISPRPASQEFFGSNIVIGQSGITYTMAVSASGSLVDRGRVYLYTYNGTEWSHLENQNYRGIYDSALTSFYPKGSIVWYGSRLLEANEDIYGDGSTLSIHSTSWTALDAVSTQCSLPQNIALDDDGSTLALGILNENQLAELIKQGDAFGTSLAMSYNGDILVIGAPNSDGQYFTNYRGIWRPDVEYSYDDVVKYQDLYYKVGVLPSDDSTYKSLNQIPEQTNNWENIGDSTTEPSGKVYVYQKSAMGNYDLKQTITAGSLAGLSDINIEQLVSSGDQFGFALDIDYSGSTLIITSPRADTNFQNQGSAYVFRTAGYANLEYRLKQKLESFEIHPNEYFGQSVSISANTEKVIVGAKNSAYAVYTRFDTIFGTTWDQRKTKFFDRQGYAGAVYVFDLKSDEYFLTEKLQADLTEFESFGYSIDCTDTVVVVGSPDYQSDGIKIGMVRLFEKDASVNSWDIIADQQPVIDLSRIKSIALYDNVADVKIQDIDYVDHAKFKILNFAEQEIKFKTLYDPAVYTNGTENQTVEPTQSWADNHIGEIWWDLSSVKWVYYEQGTTSDRIGIWNQLATGSTIDIYEWVGSVLRPSEWAGLADTNEGTSLGISGQPLYPNDDVYSVKELYSSSTGYATNTLYYYWVKGTAVLPADRPHRKFTAAGITSLIENPVGSGIPFIAMIDATAFLAYNFDAILTSDTALLNIQYLKNNELLNPIHREYQLLTDGVADSLPTAKLETKWIDSLIGSDAMGNRVPDTNLPTKQKYGLNFRPRQSMFVDRVNVLKTVIVNINTILSKAAFADIIDFTTLNSADAIPNSILNLYDTTVDDYIDIPTASSFKQALISLAIDNGKITAVTIISKGFGYRAPPTIDVEGDGYGAKLTTILNNQGQVTAVQIIASGKNYSIAIGNIRPFTVLVKNDVTANNFWSLYSWDEIRKVFYRSRSQAFNTTRYWNLIDWWKLGYGITSRIVKEIILISDYNNIDPPAGDLIRIKEFAGRGWAVFERTQIIKTTGVIQSFSDLYRMVGREKGTLEISSDFYTNVLTGIGFDNARPFDATSYDVANSLELRNILKAVKEDIFIEDYAVEWNRLFFTCIRAACAEQLYIDWAFKTSFLTATHNIGPLIKKLNYRNDNLHSFQEYVNEVKPYRTTVREYISRYNTIEPVNSAISDFDMPPIYSAETGSTIPVREQSSAAQQYPWKFWADNHSYSIVSIDVIIRGSGYTQPPKVVIDSPVTGTRATAQAYISNGQVSGVTILTAGTGYITSPKVTLVGGNGTSANIAIASAILGNSPARTINLAIKFDRITKEGLYSEFAHADQFTADGNTSVFELKYAPTNDKSKISILKNNQVLLISEYTISLYTSTIDTYSLLKGRVTLTTSPTVGDIISIHYEKNVELLDSVNRINQYYRPSSGMKGNDLEQLMTGIDFGGVQIQGTTFDVTGGWDALPWFTDNWDSVISSADFYVVCDGSTTIVTLPSPPADQQYITIYLKRKGEIVSTRIDDLYYDTLNNDSSTSINLSAQMPTFIGDGHTTVIEIGQYIETYDGDTLIFRPIESDGSVTITDTNLLDTSLSGGTLSTMSGAYSTATGRLAQDISIDGDKFISPIHVPATEENIPGQVLDSLSIRVFSHAITGSTPLHSRILVGNGVTISFDIGLTILEATSVMVYVNKVKRIVGSDYTFDFHNNRIVFITAPESNAVIEIISIGVGGIQLLDYQEFTADGATDLFLTSAYYPNTSSTFVTVDGEYQQNTTFISSVILDTESLPKALVVFGEPPANNAIVKIVCLGHAPEITLDNIGIIRVHSQQLDNSIFDGSTRSFEISNFIDLNRASTMSSMVVEANGVYLRGVDTTYQIYDGLSNEFVLGNDPDEAAGTISSNNIKVYVNNVLRTFIQEYLYSGPTETLSISPEILSVGDVIKIENDFRAEYAIVGTSLVFNSNLDSTIGINDVVNVTWFNEYPTMNLVSDEFSGGKIHYELAHTPLNVSYVWVYKNGIRLTQDQDYRVSLPRSVVYLINDSISADIIKIVLFSNSIYREPSAFEIHKDMLNMFHFNRYAILDSIRLSTDLNYYDQTINITDASLLQEPIAQRNVPGIIHINGERIEYMKKEGNVLSQLRRGTKGTAIPEIHSAGILVVDVGPSERLPYHDTQDKVDIVSDGSSLLIGPLDFIPIKSSRDTYRNTDLGIPKLYGICDQLEVFVAGRRLRKDSIDIYDAELGASSPYSDITIEAEFTVDGITPYIRLTSPVTAGNRISIIRRLGNTWYDRPDPLTNKTVTLLDNQTTIAKFIVQKTTRLPE